MSENENVNENIKLEKENDFINVFKALKSEYAWRGTVEERKGKFQRAHDELNALYGKNVRLVFVGIDDRYKNVNGASGHSAYIPPIETLIMHRKLSVITFMQLWMRAVNVDGIDAIAKSKEIFTLVFPVSARKLLEMNGLLCTVDDVNNDPNDDPLSDGSGAVNAPSD